MSTNQESISQTLLWCLLSVLSVGILIQLLLFPLIIKHKESPQIKASQPVGMSLITIGGCFTFIGGICLIVTPPTVPTCALAECVIFISITLIGSSLAAMAWRVERIASPIAMFGRRRRNSSDNITARSANVGFTDGNNKKDKSLLYKIKKRNVDILTSIAELSFRKQIAISNRSIHGSTIRQTITKRSLIKVTGFLLLPQLVFQLLGMALVQLRRYPLDDGICVRPSNTLWTIVVGTILTVLPFVSLLITVYKREADSHIPDVLSLEDSTRCIFIVFTLWHYSVVAPSSDSIPIIQTFPPTYQYIYF
jgi:hypothetical protein